MDLLSATSDLVETIRKLELWNKSSTDSEEFKILNHVIKGKNQDIIDKVMNDMLSNGTSDYDILNKALEHGYTDVAHFMLDKGCKVNQLSFVPSFTPLHNAVKLGDVQIVRKLLDAGASVLAVDSNRNTPLHLAYSTAFITEDYELVDLILTHIKVTSSYINIKNQHGLSLLHIASARGNAHVVRKFIKAGASPHDFVYDDSPTHAGYTALEFACDIKSLDVIKICREVLPNRKQTNHYISQGISEEGKENLISQMLEWFDNPYRFIIKLRHNRGTDWDRLSDFHLACLDGNLDSVKIFLNKGEDVNASMSRNAEYTPLYTALHFALESQNQCFEKIKLLLDHDADIYKRNGFCMTALHLAMYIHNQKHFCPSTEFLYNLVKEKEANPVDSNGLTYFHIAVAANDVDLVKKFLDSGEDPNKKLLSNLRCFSNYAPLHFAVKYNREEIAKLLIDRGAKVNSNKGETPLQIALESGYYRLIDLLLDHNADVKVVQSNKKMTTLLLLVEYYIQNSCNTTEALHEKEELIGFIDKLIALGVDVNAKDSDGFTALHYACYNMYNGIWLIERLLAFGADINLKNNQNETPLDVARRCAATGTYDDFLLLYHHVQRLKALGLEVDVNNEKFCEVIMEKKEEWKNNEDWKLVEDMYSDETFERKENERFHEIIKLKGDMITEDVSLYDYLRMDAEEAIDYIENERIIEIIEAEAEAFYEVYGYLVWVQYNKSLDCYLAQVSEECESE